VSLSGGGPIEELAVPSGTTVEEHDLVTDGDVLVGSQSTVEFGLRGRNVALGERVRVENDIEAEGDCRLDTWCAVDGNVLVGEDAYLGERVTVTGRLMVSGDLDIGDDVTIEEGFEANGWIVIRNPVPTLVFYFIVLSQLLRLGETDAADELATALADGDDVRDPLLIPRSAEISDDAWRVSTPATVGDDCRLHGNLRAESIRVGERDEVFGSLRAREGIEVGAERYDRSRCRRPRRRLGRRPRDPRRRRNRRHPPGSRRDETRPTEWFGRGHRQRGRGRRGYGFDNPY
jgi:predicted acyltransferase (DUF342 family)